jgi:plasmid stabilization system protein ParE
LPLDFARQVVEQPQAGRQVPELERTDIREIIERNYRIVYRIINDEVVVLTVFEGHRRFPDLAADLRRTI